VSAGGIDVRGVPETELHVDGRRDPDQLGDLVQTNEAADVVRSLDVDVERTVDRRTDRRDLRERKVGGEVDRARAELLEDARGGRVRRREHDGDLHLHVCGELARLLHGRGGREHPDVGDQDAAEPVVRGAADVVQARDHLLLPVRGGRDDRAGRRARHRRGAPGGVRPCEQGDLDARRSRRAGELVELGLGVHEDTASLRDAVHADVEPGGFLEHGVEAARPLGARDLDAVLRAVGEPLGRVGQRAQIARRQADRREEVTGRAHAPFLQICHARGTDT
jgi:hypothetical protein